MSSYYNEVDPKAAAWLRELIRAGHIPDGWVDERSICDVQAHEIAGYAHRHFFAGVAGWAFALRLAGWPDDRPVRTGSCPCQPFSAAGKGLGEKDARHLWPVFRGLIAFGEPTVTFGEQVASKAGRVWLARIRADLEGLGYGVGASDLCSACVGSPNIRQRLYWVAHPAGQRRHGPDARKESAGRALAARSGDAGRLANTNGGQSGHGGLQPGGRHVQFPQDEAAGGVGDADGAGPQERVSDGRIQREAMGALPRKTAECGSDAGRLGHSDHAEEERLGQYGGQVVSAHKKPDGLHDSNPWARYELLPCTDGKSRRIEPGTFPLVARLPGQLGRVCDPGIPFDPQACAEGRVMRLRGYGNAINPWLAAEFVIACEEALNP